MFKVHHKHRGLAAAIAGGVLALAVTGMGVRLVAGPVDGAWLKPMVERLLEAQVSGGRAKVQRVQIAWFGPEKSLGLELDGVSLTDGHHRPVLQARHVDGGLALDGLSVGRIAANDFFAVVSVSPKGKTALGYDASGESKGESQLGRALGDLVSHERLGHSASFLRRVDLTNGRLVLRQVKGPVAWTAEIRTLQFTKLNGHISTRTDLAVVDARTAARAVIYLQGAALVGLRGATANGKIEGLVPALVFPTVGGTAPLSTLDARIDGQGSISYDLKSGIRGADLTVTAGQGAWRSGADVQAFQSGQVVMGYDPKSQMIELRTLKLAATNTQLDLTGRFRLIPDDLKHHHPAHVDFMVAGPHAMLTLASDSPPQELTNVSVLGRYVPERRRFELQRGIGQIAGAPAVATAVFQGDDQARWGVKLTARVAGTVTPPQIFAFWPRRAAGPVRDWLKTAILSGQLSNATFDIDAEPGEFSKPQLTNEDMKIGFDFRDAAFRFATGFTPITAGVGHGLVQGNRFDLSLSSGKLENVALSEGSIEIDHFKPDGGFGKYKGRAIGDAHEIMTILDRAPLSLFTHNGFDPNRVGGQADLRFEIERPSLFNVPAKDYRVKYGAIIHKATLKEAALGWDLTGGELKVEGDQDKVDIDGPAIVGPYHGKIAFNTRYQGEHLDHAMNVDVNGLLNASILFGKATLATPFAGKFRIQGGQGAGAVHSPVFDGRVNWKDGNGPDRLLLNGWGSAPVLRKLGAGYVGGMPDRFPVDLRLARAGDTWRGPFRADALAANIVYSPAAQRSRILVSADVTPQEAKRLGFGAFPLFNATRQVIVDANWAGDQGAAQVRAATLNFGLAWNNTAQGGGERRVNASLSGADLVSLGLPPSLISRPGAVLQLTAAWKDTADGVAGSATVDAIPVKFQAGAGKNGAEVFTVHADLDRALMRRLGAPEQLDIQGVTSLNARWATVQRASAGRVEFDFGRAALSVDHTDWRKPVGQAAKLSVDFIANGDGPIRLMRINGDGPVMDIEGSGMIASTGRITDLNLSRTRLNGLIDASLHMTQDAQGQNDAVTLRGRWLDVRRMLADATESSTGGPGGEGAQETLRVDAVLDGVKFSNGEPLRATTIKGVWGAVNVRRLDVTAVMASGAKVWGRVYPAAGGAAIIAQTSDAGEAAKTLFDMQTLKGGSAVLSGKLVDGGADLNLEMKNVRLVHAPAMAQILTVASLRGLADTMNGDGVLFSNVVVPLQIRGHRVNVGDSRATGSALGLTAKGYVDLSKDTLDFQGTLAPAYGINSAVGHVPVLGQLLTSRKGEGVLGLGYSARGSFEKPQVSVNPLSLVTPGILRRMFEGGQTTSTPVAPAPPTKAKKPVRHTSIDGL